MSLIDQARRMGLVQEPFHPDQIDDPSLPTQVPRLPDRVEKFAQSVEHRFAATADMMLRTAEQLEERAAKLRKNADWLLGQRGLANDIREAVSFEQNSFEEVKSLALVAVGMRQEN